jgi:uncharacterized DUF497 family protein
MVVTYDAAKDVENRRKHGISLQRAEDFDFDSAFFDQDDSQDYGEDRWTAIGWLDAMIYTLILTFQPTSIRAISLRRSTEAERKLYAEYE